MKKDFSVIIPTYNEYESIVPLLESLDKELAGRSYEVIFIDDNSTDGTIELINSLSSKYPVRLVVRQNQRGLATAVVDGFKEASADIMVVMDADLQHPPRVILSLLKAIRDGADIAIASRYVPGGGNEGWSKLRQIISHGAITLAHLLLPPSRRVKDPMSGFFAIKKDTISSLKLEPRGYKVLLEIITLAHNATIAEVPFLFQVRAKGTSKLSGNQQLEYLRHIFSLMRRSGELTRFIKFALVGFSGVFVNEGTRLVLTRYAGMAYPYDAIAAPIGIEVSIISNFILNNYFTFNDRRPHKTGAFLRSFLKFNLVCLLGALLQYGIYLMLTRSFGWIEWPWDTLANLIGIVLAMLWNFLANNWWTWRR
jgi:dolichol-phosphate mannosyltransferase